MRTIFALILGLLLLGVMVGSITDGAVGEAIVQGLDQSSQYTDVTREIDASNEDEAKETFSDLAMFVRDRAVNCGEVEDRNERIPIDDPSDDPRDLDGTYEEGYPGLARTTIGVEASCVGGQSSIAREGLGILNPLSSPQDNVMAGSLSRENFEIVGDISPGANGITFHDNRNTNDENEDFHLNDVWLENNIAAASGRPVESHVDSSSDLSSSYRGTGRNYVVFFEENGVGENRIDGEALENVDGYEDSVWLGDDPDIRDMSNNAENGINQVRLCPGDKGYIQMNVEYPYNTGLGSSDFSGGDPRQYFPMIVVEESELDTCGEDMVNRRADKIPPNIDTAGRMIHITGRTDEAHPYIRQPGAWGTQEYEFNLLNFNENNPKIEKTIGSSAFEGIEFNFDDEDSDTCVMGMWDHRSSSVDSTGEIKFERGTHIDYNGKWPSRDSSQVREDLLGDRTDRNLPPRPSTRNLYDAYVEEGFDSTEDWQRTDVYNKILYDFGGERKFKLYGDLLCAPHSENDNFDQDHSEWIMCGGSNSQDVEIDGAEWSCDRETGRWSTTASSPSSPNTPSGPGPTQ